MGPRRLFYIPLIGEVYQLHSSSKLHNEDKPTPWFGTTTFYCKEIAVVRRDIAAYIHPTRCSWVGGWMDGRIGGWMGECKSRFKDCLQ